MRIIMNHEDVIKAIEESARRLLEDKDFKVILAIEADTISAEVVILPTSDNPPFEPGTVGSAIAEHTGSGVKTEPKPKRTRRTPAQMAEAKAAEAANAKEVAKSEPKETVKETPAQTVVNPGATNADSLFNT